MKTQLITSLLPLVLFWLVETYFGLKWALIVGVVAAVLELIYEKVKTSKISFLTWSSNLLVLGLGAVSFIMDTGVAFKLQPAVMEVLMGVVLIVTRMKTKTPFLTQTFKETPVGNSEQKALLMSQPWFLERLERADRRLIWFLFLHGLAIAWAAIYSSTQVWIALKGVLFYVLLVVVMAPMYKRPDALPKSKPDPNKF